VVRKGPLNETAAGIARGQLISRQVRFKVQKVREAKNGSVARDTL
jgi:hypothetical protein